MSTNGARREDRTLRTDLHDLCQDVRSTWERAAQCRHSCVLVAYLENADSIGVDFVRFRTLASVLQESCTRSREKTGDHAIVLRNPRQDNTITYTIQEEVSGELLHVQFNSNDQVPTTSFRANCVQKWQLTTPVVPSLRLWYALYTVSTAPSPTLMRDVRCVTLAENWFLYSGKGVRYAFEKYTIGQDKESACQKSPVFMPQLQTRDMESLSLFIPMSTDLFGKYEPFEPYAQRINATSVRWQRMSPTKYDSLPNTNLCNEIRSTCNG